MTSLSKNVMEVEVPCKLNDSAHAQIDIGLPQRNLLWKLDEAFNLQQVKSIFKENGLEP